VVSRLRHQIFRANDFDSVYYQFFEQVWASGHVYADPSGWRDTESPAASLLPATKIEPSDLGRYYLDEDTTLGHLKEQILQLLGVWEMRTIRWEEATLYNSASTATAAVLVALKCLGVRTILFETPAYSVTVNQAKHFSCKVVLCPTYYADGFAIGDLAIPATERPVALWLTQPRMSLGFNQDLALVERLRLKLSPHDFLVIDEATEQFCPSVLHELSRALVLPRVLRIRGILKPMGLNGLRLACVLHDTALRESLETAQNVIGASLDLYSLQVAADLAARSDLFLSMLAVANAQVTKLRRRAEFLSLGSQIRVSHLVNGYMGSIFVPFSGGRMKYRRNRARLLEYCLSRRMPVILGSSMLYAFDPDWEQIRLNYFSREQHILRAIETLAAFGGGPEQEIQQKPPQPADESGAKV
jgi:histidinol-phosphate/aromatic aminotransferase/cobyric acid decarboxylase-like protein